MESKVHSIHFKADQKLLSFVHERLNKLESINDKLITSEVFLRIDKSRDKENKISEIKLLVPGKELFAKKQCKTFEEAVDVTIDALRKQILKEKRR
jgi:putative sigma-54 modulation protein|tara:strand:+ start:726 stop:1013 length:288 start_codon:yes stop_codon:yes gene_type:complete